MHAFEGSAGVPARVQTGPPIYQAGRMPALPLALPPLRPRVLKVPHAMTDTNPLPQPPPGHRDWYAFEALRCLPRLILMVDGNPYSPTYGCFDRSFWHYRTMDFPCGMNQEFVLPLALAHAWEMPGNRYHGNERLRELALAGIDFARKSSHPDGTCDDYFPFERAMGALVFSLYAMTETCLVLGERRGDHLGFFRKRGDWLLKHNETGQLANHQAFAALAMYNVYLLTGDERYRRGSDAFRDLTLSWRNAAEGWFQEYEGADPGYHSCLIAFFAKLWQKSNDPTLVEPLVKACEFASWFQHPDGSYAGEYGSRNTYHFYPHGFEVLAPKSVHAGRIADTFLHLGLPARTRHYNDDDRMAAHYVYDWMQAWKDYAAERPGPAELPKSGSESAWFPAARLLAVRTPAYHFVANLSKGGAFKVVGPDGHRGGDSGLIGEAESGEVLVSHIIDPPNSSHSADAAKGTAECAGVFHRRKAMLPSPVKVIIFRVLLLTVGRFNANLVRSLLQKKLIVGKRPTGLRFRRRFACDARGVEVTDEIETGGTKMRRLSAPTDATSIYVANSNTFQEGRLRAWQHLDAAALEALNREGRATWRRRIDVG